MSKEVFLCVSLKSIHFRFDEERFFSFSFSVAEWSNCWYCMFSLSDTELKLHYYYLLDHLREKNFLYPCRKVRNFFQYFLLWNPLFYYNISTESCFIFIKEVKLKNLHVFISLIHFFFFLIKRTPVSVLYCILTSLKRITYCKCSVSIALMYKWGNILFS